MLLIGALSAWPWEEGDVFGWSTICFTVRRGRYFGWSTISLTWEAVDVFGWGTISLTWEEVDVFGWSTNCLTVVMGRCFCFQYCPLDHDKRWIFLGLKEFRKSRQKKEDIALMSGTYWKPMTLESATRGNTAAKFEACTCDLRHLGDRRKNMLLEGKDCVLQSCSARVIYTQFSMEKKYDLQHWWPDFWTQRSAPKTILPRSTIIYNLLILGRLGKEMWKSIITSNV